MCLHPMTIVIISLHIMLDISTARDSIFQIIMSPAKLTHIILNRVKEFPRILVRPLVDDFVPGGT